MSSSRIIQKKRLVIILILANVALLFLIGRIGWIQIVNGEKYSRLAEIQQTRDTLIPATRGKILDRKGEILALNATAYTVWSRPSEVVNSGKGEEIVIKLAEILGTREDDIKQKILNEKSNIVKVEKWIDKAKVDMIKQEKLAGIWIVEDTKRYYPYGAFASRILGHTTEDNSGLVGIELEYDRYLRGVPGRRISNTDAMGKNLSYGSEKYYASKSGLNVVLTIDETIQHFVEKSIEKTLTQTKAKRVMAIVMEPSTGDILSMAVTPDYDPNTPRIPNQITTKEYERLDAEGKQKIWNEMWRNPLISDTYEPGSTFKLITAAAALEEGVVEPNSQFYDEGFIVVAGQKLRCWRYYLPHGEQTFTQAMQNSCNPIFVEVGQRLGVDKYYKYLDTFGFTQPTGIDLPGEGKAIIQSKDKVGPVELATISYGQGISVTPLQLISAVAAIGNDGKLMKPRIVKELVDDSDNVVERFEPKMVRQVLSEKTSRELKVIMESVVTEGSGNRAYIPGYNVGGKTGTADKIVNGRYADGKVYSSFIALAPVEESSLAVLVIVDEPQGEHFGSLTAAPAVYDILSETLRYLDIEPRYSKKEAEELLKEKIMVPNVRNLPLKEAARILEENGLRYETDRVINNESKLVISDQFPKPNTSVLEKSTVVIYIETEES